MCLLPVFTCRGAEIIVDSNGSGDFTDIQSAIDDLGTMDGDIIVVRAGTYTESTSFRGRPLVVTSEDPNDPNVVEDTIISVAAGYSVLFDSTEGRDSVLCGFTIIGRGIYCYDSSPTISKNVIRNCLNRGIYGELDATPYISGNTIINGARFGIYACDGPIEGNIISGNKGGIGDCEGPITDNVISNNTNDVDGYGGGLYYCSGEVTGNIITNNYARLAGGGLYYCNGPISGNIIVGNTAVYDGGGLYYCEGRIGHNIIAGNRSYEGGGLNRCFGLESLIYNNTIVGNRAYSGGGLKDCPDLVLNNIIAFNEATEGGGIYGPSGNSHNLFWGNQGGDFRGGATKDPDDIIGRNPSFATNGYWDTSGTPGDQSDDYWVDGDYHVKSEYGRWDVNSLIWVKDGVTSEAIDKGDTTFDWSAELWPHGRRINIGAYGGTAHASMSPNDVGYIADFDHDNLVAFKDLMLFAEWWQSKETPLAVSFEDVMVFTDWWGSKEAPLAADLNRIGDVNFPDYCIFADNWLAGLLPPEPDPMTWAAEPDATSPTTISMEATTAVSTDGSGIHYWFENTTLDVNSGWQDSPVWEDTGLSHSIEYSYKVKARNTGNLQQTAWSDPLATATIPAPQPPKPNPMTWKTAPNATSSTSIAMEATTATAVYGGDVEYWFWNITTDANSGWQSSPTWEDTGLSYQTAYSYRVKARDVTNGEETGWSNPPASATTPPPENDPPTPYKMAFEEIPCKCREQGGSLLDYWVKMKAVEATDPSGPVEYKFVCTNNGAFSSDWQISREYNRKIGGQNVDVWFKVKARDIYGNETELSDVVRAMVCGNSICPW